MIDKNKVINEIINDTDFKTLIDENKISIEEINDNFFAFNDAFNSRTLCKNCKELADCKQRKKGEYLSVRKDTIINNCVAHCKYYLDELDYGEYLKKFIYSDIPKNHRMVNLENIELSTDNEKQVGTYLKLIELKKRNKGLYIVGEMGVGKTYLCIALANSLINDKRKVAFIKINDFATKMAQLIRDDTKEFDWLLNRIKKVDYLFLDDIGSEIPSEFVRDRLLLNVLDYRMENNLTTIFTSNINTKMLEKKYELNSPINAKRLIERIEILSDECPLKGVDKRRN